MKLKTLSYNLHKGYDWTGRNHVLADMKTTIHHLHADLVFIQELRGEMVGEEAQLEFLADTLWPHHSYGKNAVYPEGHHGNAILSKHPIVAQENIDLSTNRFEKRGLLHVTIEVQKKLLHLFCTHLNLLEKGRLVQCKKIAQLIRTRCPAHEPVILAGDFNDWPMTAHAIIKAEGFAESFEATHGLCAASFPSPMPVLRLDRVYYRGLECVAAEVPAIQLSDHLPLSVEFAWPKKSLAP